MDRRRPGVPAAGAGVRGRIAPRGGECEAEERPALSVCVANRFCGGSPHRGGVVDRGPPGRRSFSLVCLSRPDVRRSVRQGERECDAEARDREICPGRPGPLGAGTFERKEETERIADCLLGLILQQEAEGKS